MIILGIFSSPLFAKDCANGKCKIMVSRPVVSHTNKTVQPTKSYSCKNGKCNIRK